MFVLPNLSSSAVVRGPLPWEVTGLVIPDEVRRDKKLRDTWITLPATKHHVYSFYEGHTDSMRLRVKTGADEGNPPRFCYAIVGDFDHPLAEDEVMELCRKCSIVPNWVEKTLSGNWRVVWLFESPIPVVSFEWMTKFLKTFDKFGFSLSGLLPGLDEKAFTNPTRYWTNSGEWKKLNPNPIPANITTGWVIKFNTTYNFSREDAVNIPFDVIIPALTDKYPSFAEWPGDFVVGSQGPTFWVPASKSPKSAIVHEGGIYTFSGNASQSFYTWGDLLGREFVSKYESNKFGHATANVYRDFKNFHRLLPDGTWQTCNKDTLVTHLKVNCGLTTEPDKSGTSELDKCLSHINDNKSVDGAGHWVYTPSGVVTMNGKTILNKSKVRVMNPSSERGVWGPQGNFPFICSYLEHLLETAPLEWLIAWTSIAYRAGYTLKPQQGHALFLAGPTGIGKTLFGTAIFGRLMGGSIEGSDVLTGGSGFGSELYEYGVITVDDGSVSTTDVEHRKYSEGIKRMVANTRHKVHEKFCVPTFCDWYGRVFGSLNIDAESARQLPNMDISTLDKISIMMCRNDSTFKFPPSAEITEILTRELPFFASFLLNHEVPAHLRGDNRYILKPFHDPILLNLTHRNSRTGDFEEIFFEFLIDWFKLNKQATVWEGTAYALHREIMLDPGAAPSMRAFSVSTVSRLLGKLQARGLPIESKEERNRTVFSVSRSYVEGKKE